MKNQKRIGLTVGQPVYDWLKRLASEQGMCVATYVRYRMIELWKSETEENSKNVSPKNTKPKN